MLNKQVMNSFVFGKVMATSPTLRRVITNIQTTHTNIQTTDIVEVSTMSVGQDSTLYTVTTPKQTITVVADSSTG